MAEPPRLPGILLPWEKSIIYFVTMCVKVMPDHAHWTVSPVDDRKLSVGDFSHGFKRLLRKSLGSQLREWQRSCFDRLLRSDENLWSKWIYVKDNPVRHGLVEKADDWPYYLDFINEQGKLTASPTERRGCDTVQRHWGQ